MSLESLSIEIRDHIAEVTLLDPGKGNAQGPAFWKEAPKAFAELNDNDDVRVIVIKGSGRNFCYGLDLMAMSTEFGDVFGGPQMAEGRTRLLKLIREMQGALDVLARSPKPVIAAVHGRCIGGGLDLAAACDLRLCSKDASFSLREVKVAIVADVGSLQRLPPIIGEGATRELAFTGKDIDADRALSLGLVNEIFDDADALFAGARALAEEVAKNPPLVVQGIKQVMNRRVQHAIDDGLDYVAVWNSAFLQSEDLMEAIAAFAERREPHYKGR
ncbi:MAG: crotonase/enoyl-CoA hydratase family protein [Gemmatimonadetes bacterium]|nr:MAG: crotonase/enoyl-CoA hydratase family protein [Gemmatimonadota bacterium]